MASKRKPAAAATPKAKAKTAPRSKSKAAKPKLLAGGNPQIPKADGDAPMQAYIAAMPDWKRDVGRRLDALVVRSVPNVSRPASCPAGARSDDELRCRTSSVTVRDPRGASARGLCDPKGIALRYAKCMAQLVTRVADDLAAAVDELVNAGVVANRSEAVRLGLERLVDRFRRDEIGASIVKGYRAVPQDDEQVGWADEASVRMIADESW
jgi:Arc/MetJ-type ribon-helix-helix transcriptional regulator